MMMNLMTVLVKKVFISSKPSIVCLLCPPPCGPFSIQESAVGGLSYKVIKNVPRHILAPRRRCFSNHLPLRRVRILAERFLSYGNKVSYTIKKYPRPWQICLSRTGAHHLLSCRHFIPVFPRYHLALRSYALFIRVQISFKEFKHSKGY